MPDIGDTRLGPIIFIANPADEDTDVSVNLSEITYLLRIEEYFDPGGPPVGWYTGSFVDITSVANMILTESPDIDQGILTFQIGSPQAYRGTITIPVDSALSGNTEYTWEVNLDITHDTNTSGSVTRNYTTNQLTFTTEAGAANKPTNPTPTDTGTGIILLPILSWEAG